MGCTSSTILTRTASLKEEFQNRLQRRKTDIYEEIFISNNKTEDFVAVLCSSKSSTLATTNLQEHETSSIPKEESKDIVFTEKTVQQQEEVENNIETINIWDLLAGLEEDKEEAVDEKEEPLKSLKPLKDDILEVPADVEKGLKRKVMAKGLARLKAPIIEFERTGSLRDWLSHGGRVISPGAYSTPKFGSFEQASNGGGEGGQEDGFFDVKMVYELEEAMNEMTLEEERMLRQIVCEP